MKIDELKRIAEENDYVLTKSFDNYKLKRKNRGNCIDISNVNANRVWISNISLCDDEDSNMIKAAVEFAETPIEEREEDKKYTYKHNFIRTKGNNFTYLAIRQRLSISYPVLLGSSQDIFEYKVEFTDEEMEEVKKEYGIFLDDFKKVEVGE